MPITFANCLNNSTPRIIEYSQEIRNYKNARIYFHWIFRKYFYRVIHWNPVWFRWMEHYSAMILEEIGKSNSKWVQHKFQSLSCNYQHLVYCWLPTINNIPLNYWIVQYNNLCPCPWMISITFILENKICASTAVFRLLDFYPIFTGSL